MPHVQNPLWLETLPFGTDHDFPLLPVRRLTPVNGDWMLLARKATLFAPFWPYYPLHVHYRQSILQCPPEELNMQHDFCFIWLSPFKALFLIIWLVNVTFHIPNPQEKTAC